MHGDGIRTITVHIIPSNTPTMAVIDLFLLPVVDKYLLVVGFHNRNVELRPYLLLRIFKGHLSILLAMNI